VDQSENDINVAKQGRREGLGYYRKGHTGAIPEQYV